MDPNKVLLDKKANRERLKVETKEDDSKYFYDKVVLSPNKNYILGIGRRNKIIVVKVGKIKNFEESHTKIIEDFKIRYHQSIPHSEDGDINDRGEAVIYESLDNQQSRIVLKDSQGENKFVKNFDKNFNTVGISEKGEVITVTPVAWSEISLFNSKGNEIWTKDIPKNFQNFYDVEFNHDEDEIILTNPHNESKLVAKNEQKDSESFEDIDDGFNHDKSNLGFQGKYNEFHSAFHNDNYEKTERLYEELKKHKDKKKFRKGIVYTELAEAKYRLGEHLNSIKFWKKAYEQDDFSSSRIKQMRKPFRALVRNREDYNDQRIIKEWQYFQENFEPYINENDRSKLPNISGEETNGDEAFKEIDLSRKYGIIQRVCDYIAVKPGGTGFHPQRLDFYNPEGKKVGEEEFNQKLTSVIPTSEGFVVKSGDHPRLKLIYFNEKLERLNSLSSDNYLNVSPGHRKILAWDKEEGELHIFGPQETNSYDKIFSDWEKGVEINSYYDRKLSFEVSYSDEEIKVDTDKEGESAFEPGDTHPLRSMSYLNGYLYVGYGQHLFRLEPTEDGLEYVDQLDFTDENRDENWVNYVRTIQDELIIGRYDGEILSIKPEMELENKIDVERKINYQTFSMSSENNEKVFGIKGVRENSEVIALNSNSDSWVKELSTSKDPEVFTSDKFFGYSFKDTVKVYNYDFEEVFSQRYASKIRCDILGKVLCVSGEKLRFYKLNN